MIRLRRAFWFKLARILVIKRRIINDNKKVFFLDGR